jgi:hypothetical protein
MLLATYKFRRLPAQTSVQDPLKGSIPKNFFLKGRKIPLFIFDIAKSVKSFKTDLLSSTRSL